MPASCARALDVLIFLLLIFLAHRFFHFPLRPASEPEPAPLDSTEPRIPRMDESDSDSGLEGRSTSTLEMLPMPTGVDGRGENVPWSQGPSCTGSCRIFLRRDEFSVGDVGLAARLGPGSGCAGAGSCSSAAGNWSGPSSSLAVESCSVGEAGDEAKKLWRS